MLLTPVVLLALGRLWSNLISLCMGQQTTATRLRSLRALYIISTTALLLGPLLLGP